MQHSVQSAGQRDGSMRENERKRLDQGPAGEQALWDGMGD